MCSVAYLTYLLHDWRSKSCTRFALFLLFSVTSMIVPTGCHFPFSWNWVVRSLSAAVDFRARSSQPMLKLKTWRRECFIEWVNECSAVNKTGWQFEQALFWFWFILEALWFSREIYGSSKVQFEPIKILPRLDYIQLYCPRTEHRHWWDAV